MRSAVYVVALIVLLPYLALAAGFLVLGAAIAGGTLAAFFATLLAVAVWMIPWGLLGGAIAFVALLALAASERHRWIGAACLCAGAAVSLTVIVVMPGDSLDGGQLLFLLPGAIAGVAAGSVAASDFRQRGDAAAAPTPT